MTMEFVAIDRPPPVPVRDEGDMVEWLRHAGESVPEAERPAMARWIADEFPTFASARLRNAAALALADLHYPDLEAVLNGALAREEIALSGGTLLFALDEAAGRVTHPVIRNIVSRGSYEARAELMILLEKGLVAATSDADAQATAVLLTSIVGGTDRDAAEAAEIALDLLDAF